MKENMPTIPDVLHLVFMKVNTRFLLNLGQVRGPYLTSDTSGTQHDLSDPRAMLNCTDHLLQPGSRLG